MLKPNPVLKFAITLAVCFGVGGMGALLTTQDSITTWYVQLQKPFFTPPDWVFGPAWTILYLFMAISAFLIWNRGFDHPEVRLALKYFLIQLVLNGIWTPLFFGFHLILIAFMDIILLWWAISAAILAFKKISLRASILLIPYLIWVTYAAILNAAIWYLNK